MAEENIDIQRRFEKRHQDMLLMYEKRRLERLKDISEKVSNSDVFLITFNKEKREITELLNSLNSVEPLKNKLDISNLFETISQKMLILQKFVSDSASDLPSYDIRRAQEILSEIRNSINLKRELLLPKTKFAFKSRVKITEKNGNNECGLKKVIDSTESSLLSDQTFGFSNLVGKSLSLNPSECHSKCINLINLQDCTVEIKGCPSAMQIQNISNTIVHCGPISRAIFINGCYDSALHLACQQLRIHSTFNTNFYILVRSKAVIEDCEHVGFGEYMWRYDGITEHMQEAGLEFNVNNWRNVDDFNWLKLNEKSPNWFIINE
ncbi:tubulin-specific chaperone C [Hydra vulgaris]|uniref:tubulin-specific chaperone C n=1 Tax=Hydra vulgaris TaxID=6087 RepID=UPI001F5F31CC|nr:tubulin-specific chaperone C [Hydra vulgaris]